jgi:aspartokinase/homoserine dehydrogenase 2
MAAVLNQLGLEAAWLDARSFLRAERAAQPQVDEGLSYPLLQQLMAQHPNKRLVVTGFISRNNAGETVLLGRNGSDYSATQIGAWRALLASLSGATAGVYSADPRKVKDACLLPLLRWMKPASWRVWPRRCCMPARCSRSPAAISICSYAAAIRRNRVPRALSACWPPVPARGLSPAMTTSA